MLLRPAHAHAAAAGLSNAFHRYSEGREPCWQTPLFMIAQAFLYNAIFFTYALVLTNFQYHVPS